MVGAQRSVKLRLIAATLRACANSINRHSVGKKKICYHLAFPWRNPRFLISIRRSSGQAKSKKKKVLLRSKTVRTSLDDCVAIDQDHQDEGFRSGLIRDCC